MNRYLGIDFGEKRVGLAISDPSLTIAQPLKTITYASPKLLFRELSTIIQQYSVTKIVCGLPLSMKGGDSQKTREVREFAKALEMSIGVPVFLFDERLTTLQAELTLHQLGKKPSRNRDKIDQLAAQFILQTFLDQQKGRLNHE
jgi:putative Holliday junction resolvase